MAYVLDASVACAWAFADEATPALDALLDETIQTEVYVPSIWRSEVMNVLIQASRRGRISSGDALAHWEYLQGLGLTESGYAAPMSVVMDLAQKHQLTAYDATYLALASQLRLPLATLDAALTEAARGEGIDVLGQ